MIGDTDVSICNFALLLIGIDPISSLSESSPAAQACARAYPVIRNSVLSEYNWRVAVRKRQISLLADAVPLNEWTRIHAFPTDMLQGPHAVFGDGSAAPTHDWEIYDGRLYSNYESVVIDYSAAPDESAFPPILVDFLGHALAAGLAVPLTGDKDMAAEYRIKAYGAAQLDRNGGLFAAAKRAMAQSQKIKTIQQNGNPLVAARR